MKITNIIDGENIATGEKQYAANDSI